MNTKNLFTAYLLTLALLLITGCSTRGVDILSGIDTIRTLAPLIKLPSKKGEVTIQASPNGSDATFSYKLYTKQQSFSIVRNQIHNGAQDWEHASDSTTIKVEKGKTLYVFHNQNKMDLTVSWQSTKQDCDTNNTCLTELVITQEITG